MTIHLDNHALTLSKKLFRSTVIVEGDEVPISVFKDTITRVAEIISTNYDMIKNYYRSHLKKNGVNNIHTEDLSTVCLKIMLYYLRQYSNWKVQYKKSVYDIRFYEKDFDHPTTMDIVIHYFIEKNPESWKEISAAYLDLTKAKLDAYWQMRQDYYNK